jgi:hypothetical protein
MEGEQDRSDEEKIVELLGDGKHLTREKGLTALKEAV